MLHILPEISEELAGAGEKLGIEFLPHLVLCSGFFLIYLVEELVELVIGDAHEVLGVGHNHNAEAHNDTERPRDSYGATTETDASENTRFVYILIKSKQTPSVDDIRITFEYITQSV